MDLLQQYVLEGFLRAASSKDFRAEWVNFVSQPYPTEWDRRMTIEVLDLFKAALESIEANFARFQGGSPLLKKSRIEMMVLCAADDKYLEDFYAAYIVAIEAAIKAGAQIGLSEPKAPAKQEQMQVHLHPTFDIKLDNQPGGPVAVHVVSMPARTTKTQVERDADGNIVSSTQLERDLAEESNG